MPGIQWLVCLILALVLVTVGCNPKKSGKSAGPEPTTTPGPDDDDDDNDDNDSEPTPTPGPDDDAKIPAPFWRAKRSLTYLPDWYANKGAVTREVNAGDDLEALIRGLTAGDHLLVHAGTFTFDGYTMITGINGNAENPIVIRGAPDEEAVFTNNTADENIIEFNTSSYLIIEGIKFTGASKALRLHEVNNIVVLDNVVDQIGNNAFVANSAPSHHLYFINNDIGNTGKKAEGFYIGSDNGPPDVSHHTFIIGNYVHDLVGPTVEQGDGIEVKFGSYAVTVKYNFVKNAAYPGITIMGTGHGDQDQNIVEENVVIGGLNNGMEIMAEVIVRNNLVVNPVKAGIRIKPPYRGHMRVKNLEFVNNTVVTDGRGLKISDLLDVAGAEGNIVANNAIYSGTGQHIYFNDGNWGGTGKGANLELADLSAFTDLATDGTKLDATPKTGSALVGSGEAQYAPDKDMLGNDRSGAVEVGAIDLEN